MGLGCRRVSGLKGTGDTCTPREERGCGARGKGAKVQEEKGALLDVESVEEGSPVGGQFHAGLAVDRREGLRRYGEGRKGGGIAGGRIAGLAGFIISISFRIGFRIEVIGENVDERQLAGDDEDERENQLLATKQIDRGKPVSRSGFIAGSASM